MCLIIQREPNFEIPFEKFESAIHTNPDGYGISYADNGRLHVMRSPKKPDPEALYKMINEELLEVPMLIHFRFTTAGATNLRNAHPFPVLEYDKDGLDLRMAHNGTIGKFKTNSKIWESDTRSFVRQFVRPLMKRMIKAIGPEALLNDEFTQMLLKEQIPSSSVLSFIDSNGNTMNINELGNGGGSEEGWYFSNKYSFNRTHREPTTSVGQGFGGYYGDYGGRYGHTGYWSGYDDGTNSKKKSLPPVTDDKEDVKLGDTNVEKFTKKYDIDNIHELCMVTDEVIDELVEKVPNDAALMIKELLFELAQAYDENVKFKGIIKTLQNKLKGEEPKLKVVN